MDRHREIANWYKLLYEAVWFYGSKVKEGQKFYTGLNIRLGFETFSPRFYCPFSTTTDHDIADRFTDDSGIIMQLAPLSGSFDTCFNVQ